MSSDSDTKRIAPEEQPDEQESRDESQSEAADETGSGALATGTLLQERYEILKILGVGGMGAVYEARDLRFSQTTRLCAVKEIVSIIPDPEARKNSLANFEREANVLAELSHPAIPKVYDFFSEEPRNYLILEFIEGRDLETVLQTTPSFLDESEVLGWSIQICDVLAYLHSREPDPIMFRDVKPSNIMLRNDGRIILIEENVRLPDSDIILEVGDEIVVIPDNKELEYPYAESERILREKELKLRNRKKTIKKKAERMANFRERQKKNFKKNVERMKKEMKNKPEKFKITTRSDKYRAFHEQKNPRTII